MHQNSQLLTKLGHTTNDQVKMQKIFANISQSSPCSWQKIPDAFHDNFNRDYHILATSHRLCTLHSYCHRHCSFFFPGDYLYHPRATMNYTVVQGNSLVQWCIFVFFFEERGRRIINYRQRFHN